MSLELSGTHVHTCVLHVFAQYICVPNDVHVTVHISLTFTVYMYIIVSM